MTTTISPNIDLKDVQSVDDLLATIDPILAPQTRGLTLSIFIEAGRIHEEALQARIRFKSEILERQRELADHEQYADQAEALIGPALRLLDDQNFWDHQQGGLAFFATSERSLALRCARRFPTSSRFGGDFHLLPLLEAAALARRFYVLGLSEGTAYLRRVSDLGEEALPGIPASFAEALTDEGFTAERLEEKEFSNKNVRANEHSQQALRAIDEAVRKAVPDPQSPLILAAVDFVANSFREITKNPHLAEARLSGDPDRLLSSHELGDRARSAMLPHFRKVEREEAENALSLMATDEPRALTDLPAIVEAASNANLATLTLARGMQAGASLAGDGLPVSTEESLPPHLRGDLIDFAARRCLADGGKLTFVEREDLPEETPFVAHTRWEPVSKQS